MGQDIRKMFEEERKKENHTMVDGHEARFMEKLDVSLQKEEKSSFFNWKIAAAVALLVCGTWFVYTNLDKPVEEIIADTEKIEDVNKISLGSLSPDLKVIEDYYQANINLKLSQLDVSNDNKALVDSFMEQLSKLDEEYKKLSTELNSVGPNDQLIAAMVKNLQLRLQLLQKLGKKLNDLKTEKNETNIV